MLTLQNIITPETEICSDSRLYYRETGAVALDLDSGVFHLSPGQRVSFDTYFNLFNLESWYGACQLNGLFLELRGLGKAEIQVTQVLPGRSSPEVLLRQFHSLRPDDALVLDLTPVKQNGTRGVMYLTVTALSEPLQVHSAHFATNDEPEHWPQLTLSITTYRREVEVKRTVARLEHFLNDYENSSRVRLQVVDNGQNLDIASNETTSVFPNPNLGGAGGFARGLLEAKASGASHCLFMDDDAAFHMENITRAYAFLALARDARTALAGAMINTTHKWALWENGAWFDGACRPMHNGVDLRRKSKLMRLQLEENRPKPETFYGGWWFFAFPVSDLTHFPFPFFVRGDDVSFSISNDFDIRTLNGVVSFQDDFTEKESALTLYLDLRNHLVHHLVFDCLSRSPLSTARVALRFIMRSLLRLHYSSAKAQLLAWRDVIAGPSFFDENIDMSMRRATIKDLAADEVWQEITPPTAPGQFARTSRTLRRLRTWSGLLTLNGHLIPFWSKLGSHRVLSISRRGLVYYALGAARITFLNTDQDRAYTLRHSKRRFFGIAWEMTTVLYRFCRDFRKIKTDWRKGYDAMTREAYWSQRQK